jgi:hypothetical protein
LRGNRYLYTGMYMDIFPELQACAELNGVTSRNGL